MSCTSFHPPQPRIRTQHKIASILNTGTTPGKLDHPHLMLTAMERADPRTEASQVGGRQKSHVVEAASKATRLTKAFQNQPRYRSDAVEPNLPSTRGSLDSRALVNSSRSVKTAPHLAPHSFHYRLQQANANYCPIPHDRQFACSSAHKFEIFSSTTLTVELPPDLLIIGVPCIIC